MFVLVTARWNAAPRAERSDSPAEPSQHASATLGPTGLRVVPPPSLCPASPVDPRTGGRGSIAAPRRATGLCPTPPSLNRLLMSSSEPLLLQGLSGSVLRRRHGQYAIVAIMVADLKAPRSEEPAARLGLWPSFAIYLP